MQFFTSDPIQFQEIIALLSHIKISVCSMSWAGNTATCEKLGVILIGLNYGYPGFHYRHRIQEREGGGGGLARVSIVRQYLSAKR